MDLADEKHKYTRIT